MLIGDPANFAIEVMVEPDLQAPSAVWGRMCVHIAGTILGDFSVQYCALSPAYAHFYEHAKSYDRLWDTTFDNLSTEEIHAKVHHAIYGNDERTMDEIQRDYRRFRPFDFLTNWGKQFDGYSAVLVSPEPDIIMVLHRPPMDLDSPPHLLTDFVVARCSRDAFCHAAANFVVWFDREAERLQQKRVPG